MADTSDLRFDRAAYASGASAPCGNCQKSLGDEYWQWHTHVVCARCRAVLATTFAGSRSLRAFGKALVQGGLVALGCGIAYALFVGLTQIQLAFATIGIGFVVAKVVRKASHGVGGVRFQVLAVALTYLASTMGYAPGIWRAVTEKHAEAPAASKGEAAPNASPARPQPDVSPAADVRADTKPSDGARAQKPSAWSVLMALGMLFGIMLAAPFLEITEAPIGVLIVVFGLWEAWKLSRGVPVEIKGPFKVAPQPTEPLAP